MESQEWFSHLIKTMDMLSKSFESRGETKFHALIPGQAQSLIFDGLVVEATLAREMAEEEKARLLAQPSLPTILRPAPLAYLGKHTARKTHSEYIWDWWDWFQKLNAAPATCSRCESGGLSKVVSQYLTTRLIQCCKNKSITNIKARQYLESRWCARCKGVDPFTFGHPLLIRWTLRSLSERSTYILRLSQLREQVFSHLLQGIHPLISLSNLVQLHMLPCARRENLCAAESNVKLFGSDLRSKESDGNHIACLDCRQFGAH